MTFVCTADNKRVSGSLRCIRSTQICGLRPQTSDTRQPLYAIMEEARLVARNGKHSKELSMQATL